MDIGVISQAVNGVSGVTGVPNLSKNIQVDNNEKNGVPTFEYLLNSAMGLVKETEDYTNLAEQAELEYMLGLNDSITDLLIAQTKANISLQYTVAVKNSVLDAYKEIMNLQF